MPTLVPSLESCWAFCSAALLDVADSRTTVHAVLPAGQLAKLPVWPVPLFVLPLPVVPVPLLLLPFWPSFCGVPLPDWPPAVWSSEAWGTGVPVAPASPGAGGSPGRGVGAAGGRGVAVGAWATRGSLSASPTSASATAPSAAASRMPTRITGSLQRGVVATRAPTSAPQLRHHSWSGVSGAPQRGHARVAGSVGAGGVCRLTTAAPPEWRDRTPSCARCH